MKKNLFRLLSLVLALMMLLGTVAHAEEIERYQEAPLLNIFFPAQSNLNEMYNDSTQQAIFVAALALDLVLFGDGTMDSETIINLISNDQVYIVKGAGGFCVCQIFGETGEFYAIFIPGDEEIIYRYDEAAQTSDPENIMTLLTKDNADFPAHYKVSALNVLTAITTLAETLQEGLE